MNFDLREKRDISPFLVDFKEKLKKKVGKKEDPIILVQGGYGKFNTGDDTLLLVAQKVILSVYPSAKVIALCYDPQIVKEYFGIDGIYYGSVAAIRSLFICDGIVVAGGGLINDVYSNSYIYNLFDPRGKFALFTSFIVACRKKFSCIFLVGIHAIPNFIVYWMMRLTLPRLDVLGVRDIDSVNKLKELGIQRYYLAHDAALLYSSEEELSKSEIIQKYNLCKEQYVVFNFRFVKEKDISEKVVEILVEYLFDFHQKYPNYDICMVPFSVHKNNIIENDVIAMQNIKSKLYIKYGVNTTLIDYYLTPSQVKNIMKYSDFLILTRHHALVLSYEYHIPTIVISYNIKCSQFAQLAEYKYVYDYYNLEKEELVQATNKCMKDMA